MGTLIVLGHIPYMSDDHTEKPCPLDWLDIWGIPARQQHFCQYQLISSLQFEEGAKQRRRHYHFQELYLEEEES